MKCPLKVLFLCKKRTVGYGVSTGLLNSSQFIVNYLVSKGIEAHNVACQDANSIDKEVAIYKPTHVVISAIWVTPDKLKELIYKYKNVKWLIRIHSKIPFIANEGIAFEWLIEYTNIDRWQDNLTITGNSVEFCTALNLAFDLKVPYLPNIYHPTYKPNIVRDIKDGVVDIGCFGAIRPLKNQLLQAMAAIGFGNKIHKPIRFHINSDRLEQSGEQVLKNIRALFKGSTHKLIEHPWMPHEEFLKLVATMDIGMQASITETFNIVCADFVYMGIPIIVSKEINWMEASYVVDPLNINQIIEMLKHVHAGTPLLQERWDIHKLRDYNKRSERIWMDYLQA